VRNASGACEYSPAHEGVLCDDGDACTHGDVCDAGVCAGTHAPSSADILGVASSFGAEPTDDWLEGLATFVSDDRIVFLESNSMSHAKLTLVSVTEQGLVPLSQTTSDVAYAYTINSVIYWSYEPTTFVLPMTQTRFAVVGSNLSNRGIEVFDIVGDAMVSRGFTVLPERYAPSGQEDGLTLHGAAARGDALFLCGDASQSRRLRAYTYDDANGQFTKVADIATPSGGCRELALSPDGTRLFLAANGGYRVYDVTDPTVFAVPTMPELHVVLVPDHALEDIDVSATHVALLTARPAGEIVDVKVLDRSGTMLGAIPAPRPGAVPFGMALDGSSLFVEWGSDFTTKLRYSTSVHALESMAWDARATFSTREGCCGSIDTSVFPAARAGRVVVQPWRHVLGFDGANSALSPITGSRHGSLRTVLPLSSTEVFAFGAATTHRVDVSDPAAPFLANGETVLPTETSAFLLARFAEDAPIRLVSPQPRSFFGVEQKEARERFAILDLTVRPPVVSGSGFVEGERGDSAFGFGAGMLVQVTPVGTSGYTLRRFASENLLGGQDVTWLPDVEAFVPLVVAPTFPRFSSAGVGVSADGASVLVFEVRATTGTPAQFARAATWFTSTPDGFAKLAEADFDNTLPHATDIAVVGDVAVVLGSDRIAVLRREGAEIVALVTHAETSDSIYQRILRFDGEQIVISRHTWYTDEHGVREHRWMADVLRVSDLMPVAQYRMPDEARTLEVVGEHLVFGTNTAVVVAAPACAP
jgi:hypothetical protein